MTVAFTKPLGPTRSVPQSHYAVAPSGVPRQQQCDVTPSGTARPRPSQQVSLLPRDLVVDDSYHQFFYKQNQHPGDGADNVPGCSPRLAASGALANTRGSVANRDHGWSAP
eukprot:4485689-Pyramimonas_sp.AAC.1